MIFFPALALLLSTQPDAPDDGAPAFTSDTQARQEVYDSLLSCAAFHTIEAARGDELTRASQKAAAQDYARAATPFSSDGQPATVNDDLGKLLQQFQAQLESGETRAMAEQWTALERSCAELHSVKDRLSPKSRADRPGQSVGER